MLKQELIERLNEFVAFLDNDKLIDKTQTEEEIEQIEKSRQKLIFEANILERKLQDDSNYKSFNYMKNKAMIDYQVKLASLEQNQLQIKANIKNDNYRLSFLEGEISAANSLLSQEQKDLEELGVAYRALGENPTKEDDAKISSRMEYHRENIKWLMNELNNYTTEQEELKKSINENNKRLEDLDNYTNRYQSLLEQATEKDSNDTKVDLVKKENDERKLLELKALVNSFNNREDYLNFNLSLEISGIIANLENDEITVQEALEDLKEIKANVPSFSISKDYGQIEEELENNHRMQAELSATKAHLEQKLSDEQNYTSVFTTEMVQQDIKELENRISRYDANIASIDAEISNINSINKANDIEIISLKAEISKLESTNDELRLRSVLLSGVLTDQGLKVIEKEKSNNKKEIEKINSKIDRIQKSIVEAELIISLKKKYIKSLEVIKNKDVKELDVKKETLSNNVVDKNAMLKDELELREITNQINILKNSEANITFDYEEELNKIITDLEKVNEITEKENIIPQEEVITNDDLNDEYEDFYPIGEIEEKNLPVVSEKNEIVEYNDDDVIPISFWKKAKDKVLAKLKDQVFIRRVKAGMAALLISLGLGYGAGMISKNSNNNPSTEIVDTSSDYIDNNLQDYDPILKPIPGYPEIEEDIIEDNQQEPETDNNIDNEENDIQNPTKPEEVEFDEIVLSPGETYITTTPDGNTVMVDNSNGNNDNVIPPSVGNYDENDGIKVENSNGNLNVTVPNVDTQEEVFTKATDDITADYLKLLEELGITSENNELGRTK